jgi:hypothetical protein
MLLTNKQYSPSHYLVEDETEHIILSFCTFCTLLVGKKLSFQNVFLLVLKDVKLKNILKNTLDVDSDFEIVKMFIDYDNTITKSKYVTKYINSLKK